MKKLLIGLLVFFCLLPIGISAQNLNVGPYLQDAEPNSIVVMWETSLNTSSRVSYGLTPALGNVATGASNTGFLLTRIHRVMIDGLQPNTTYYYSANGGNRYTDTIEFKTPPMSDSEESFGMIAFSDMQKDGGQPNKFKEIVEEGVLDYVSKIPGEGSIPDKLGFVLVPGDLVAIGLIYPSWKDEFFDPGQNLFEMVPVYPVLGNHEANTVFFYNYFDLPKNGTGGFMEQWWYKDYSNTRIIGLESNTEWITGNNGIQKQLDWLQDVLEETCGMDHIDFVFAQLHHPYHSELWPDGNRDFTGDVIELLENFSTDCGKPSIHFYGHTHGYQRGQSKDHKHLMVNVASAGGNLDRWGEYNNQRDYEEHTRSEGKYGFVYLEVNGGEDPHFTLKRISRGVPGDIEDNVLTDSLVIYRSEAGPDTPEPVYPVDETVTPECLILETAPFSSEDPNVEHGAAQWQVFSDCNTDADPVVDIWKQFENMYYDVDLQQDDDLTDEDVSGLFPNSEYCWRVRFRDKNLRWSEWSALSSFQTGKSVNLIKNNGAELGIEEWTAVAGNIESNASGECDGIAPFQGSRYFAVGAACNPSAYGEAYQISDISDHQEEIDAGTKDIWFGAVLSNWSGTDRPEFRLTFLDENGSTTGMTQKFAHQGAYWKKFDKITTVPVGTRQVKFELFGNRNFPGTANDSYFDELYLVIDSLAGRFDTVICAGETVDYFGETLDSEGTFTITDDSNPDCLNEYQITVSVSDTFYSILELAICSGDSVEVAGVYFHDEGSYEIDLGSSNTCDSTILLDLTVLAPTYPACLLTGVNDALVGNTVDFYPNPMTDKGILRLSKTPDSELSLNIYNGIGNLVMNKEHILTDEIIIDRKDLSSGLYFYTLKGRSKRILTGNFVIVD